MREPEKKMLPIGDVQSERVRTRRKLVSEWTYFRCYFGGGKLEVECPGIDKGVLVGLITETQSRREESASLQLAQSASGEALKGLAAAEYSGGLQCPQQPSASCHKFTTFLSYEDQHQHPHQLAS